MMFQFVPDPAGNAVLNMINRDARSASEGMEAALLKYRWHHAGFDEADLHTALQAMVDEGRLEIVSRDQEPMVRLTDAGYQALVAATNAQQPAPTMRVAPRVEETRDVQIETRAGEHDAPAPESADAPEPVAADADGDPDAQARPAHDAAPRTEFWLRNEVLNIYAELDLPRDSELIARTISRYWAAADRRGEDLRLAMDILLRDGHLEPVRQEFETFFRLTRDGDAYLQGKSPPDSFVALIPLADPAYRAIRTVRDGPLMRELISVFDDGKHADIALPELQNSWADKRLHPGSLFHGLDLLLRDDFLEWQPAEAEQAASLRITPDGLKFRKIARKPGRRLDTLRAFTVADSI